MEQALPIVGGTLPRNIMRSLLVVATETVVGLPVRLRSEYGRASADQALAATDLENLSDWLDAIGSDQEFWDSEFRPNQDVNWETALAEAQATPLDMPSLTRTLGLTAARRCEQGWAAVKDILKHAESFKKDLEKHPPSPAGAGPVPSSPQKLGLIDLAYDATLGPAFRRAVALFLRTLAAAAVIARAEERGQRLEPWLALGLANAWAEGPERLARALADPDTIPGWIETFLSHAEAQPRAQALLEQWRQAAIASGEGIYFPFEQSDGRVDKDL